MKWKKDYVTKSITYANLKAMRFIRTNVENKNQDPQFESYDMHSIGKTPSRSYMCERTNEGEFYKETALHGILSW